MLDTESGHILKNQRKNTLKAHTEILQLSLSQSHFDAARRSKLQAKLEVYPE